MKHTCSSLEKTFTHKWRSYIKAGECSYEISVFCTVELLNSHEIVCFQSVDGRSSRKMALYTKSIDYRALRASEIHTKSNT